MQDALLPDELPVVPGLDVAASYLLHTDDAVAGGDWFDAVVRPDGRVALAVGDVVGHGVAASAVMGQLRAVLHERLTSHAPLGVVLDDLDRYARTRPESRATTLAIAEVHPDTGVFTYCTAGHPPPLLVTAASTVFLPTSGAGPLATGHGRYPMREGRLDPGELLLLYTDGLVDRPGRTLGQNTVELAEVMSAAYGSRTAPPRTSERVCTLGLEALTTLSGHSDDLTVLAAQRVPVVQPLELRVPAELGSIGLVRRELDTWFDRLDVRPLDRFSVQHAVGELVTNAVEHAYPQGSGEVVVTVAAHSAGLVAQISDSGRWLHQTSPLPARGNGLAMARGLVDHVDIETGETGTVVTTLTQLTRPAQMLRARRPGLALPATSGESFDARDQAPGLLRLSGALDAGAADQLRARIRRAGAGGTRPLVLDLAGVSHLGSSGVQALHETVAESSVAPRLYAPAGSVAQQVLELVRLPYETTPPAPQ